MASFRISRLAMWRRSRAMNAPRLWKSRFVFWLGALAIGAISAGFAIAADFAQKTFAAFAATEDFRLAPLIVTPLGFVACAWVAQSWIPNSQGSGIPQAMAARVLRDLPDRGAMLSLKIAVGKVALTVVGLFCGASIGREGPTVQVGASIMMAAGRFGGIPAGRGLILAGSAAGIAAAFNTPVAGIVFAIEEMSRAYKARTNGVVLITVIIAGLSSLGILGNYTYFGHSDALANGWRDWVMVLVCGLAGGLAGALFSRGTILITRRLRRWRSASAGRKTVIVALVAGIVTAVAGVACDGLTWGTGYDVARAAIEGQAPPPTYFLAKLVSTLAATVSGIPGGLFAPSLSVGAGLGATVALILSTEVGLAAILGMAGYFAGVTQAPMTAFVIIIEMTGNHEIIVPVMAAAMLGYGTSRFISPEPLYATLSRLFVADALRQARAAGAAGRAAAAQEVAAVAEAEAVFDDREPEDQTPAEPGKNGDGPR
ncbi:chloride channel protein [Sinirhodobacter huangdaonensis]|uniref:Chloride channel protein n=1 Tax=Paenirhodobacter huangdaonensis TaxID=2501515 RepID=A0A3S3LWX7_9RHOB|nr:chloride channel protein [Sinirhodobacter huangdaonensis]RWR54865.1 chloride channel protein [Sinirhodobacter huangdaonensis]